MALSAYHQKRNFDLTHEPKGSVTPKKGPLVFVIQKHQASHLHYDFRLELEGVLKSWAVPKGPPSDPSEKRLAVQVEDHPYEYQKFEGTIPKGEYGAGTVEIWDEGTYEAYNGGGEKELLEGLKKGDLKFILHGKKLKGPYGLVQFGEEKKNWLLIQKKEQRKPVIETTSFPHDIGPMLAQTALKPFDSSEFLYEAKWDGYRIRAEIQDGAVKLFSRNGNSYTNTFPQITDALSKLKHTLILDGEVVAFDAKGHSSFQFLQESKEKKDLSIVYEVFDLLYIDGKDVRSLPLLERKKLLDHTLEDSDHIKKSDYIIGHGLELFHLAQSHHSEGIIAKSLDSPYLSQRTSNWQKIKNIQSQEAIVCGFTKPRKSRAYFGALLLGIYDDHILKFVGHTGSGFDDSTLKEMAEKLKPLITKTCPFNVVPKTNEPATWVKPNIVVQVNFQEWTADKIMRIPIFQGIRQDKKADEVTFETPVNNAKETKGTNTAKIFWPKEGYTKGDVLEYYQHVANTILPYLKDRPESLNRHPNGIEGESFFQKDMVSVPEWLKLFSYRSEHEEKDIHWLICNDTRTLLYMVQLGCIELNPWISRAQHPKNPDFMLFDLDPHEVDFSAVKETAHCLKEILDTAKIPSFVKTTGKVGLHVVVPLGAKYTYDQSRKFSEVVASMVAEKIPTIASLERLPEKRKKKVYVDFLQNRIGQTMAAAYCLRPFPGALVSAPLEWEELRASTPQDFTIKSMPDRLASKHDVWKKFRAHPGIDMLASLKRLTHT